MGVVMKVVMKKVSMKATTKKPKVSVIAKGALARYQVFSGMKTKTASGFTKSDLIKNKRGKIVTKAQNAAGKKAYKQISAWTKAVNQAKKALGLSGFIIVGGKTPQGKALYAKAKSIHAGA